MLGDNVTISAPAASILTVAAGGIVSNGGTTLGNTMSVPQVTFSTTEGILLTNNGSMTVNSVIAGTVGLTINGGGNVTLNSVNTYTGTTSIDTGTPTAGTGKLTLNNAALCRRPAP